MLAKLISLLIRGAIFVFTFGLLALILYKVFDAGKTAAEISMIGGWILGGLWALLKFNSPFRFVESAGFVQSANEAAHSAGDNLVTSLSEKRKRKTADEMLELKRLLDEEILSQVEYDSKMSGLKKKYLK